MTAAGGGPLVISGLSNGGPSDGLGPAVPNLGVTTQSTLDRPGPRCGAARCVCSLR